MSGLRIVPSAELRDAEWDELTALCVAAFDEPWDGYWDSIGPGIHVIAADEAGRILAHAAIVDRLLYPADLVVPAAYVEAVAVLPERQRSGLGTTVMEVIDRIIAGTNCGMAPMRWDIAFGKLEALGKGAELARKRFA